MNRRSFHRTLTATLAATVFGGRAWGSSRSQEARARTAPPSPASSSAPTDWAVRLQAIEEQSGGRLGVAVFDTTTGQRLAHRADERFPMCSTFKLIAAAVVLQRVDAGQENLERRMRFGQRDLVANSPVTEPRAGGDGMTLAELCAAAITRSDNTAANLLLRSFGGPQRVTALARSLGDTMTRLDHAEPDLNEGRPGDETDTTTPHAMLHTLSTLVLGDALSPKSRTRLTEWLIDNRTGDRRLRAGLPRGWRVGDKTGTGAYGSNADMAVIWPPARAPIVVTSYLTGTDAPWPARDATLASVGALVATMI